MGGVRRGVIRALRRLALPSVAAALVLSPAVASSQSLDDVDRLVRDGAVQEAREALLQWEATTARPTRGERQRALWFRSLLTVDPAAAAAGYRILVLEYPGGPFTDRALLRLGRLAELQGDLLAAEASFSRLARDYPSSPARLEAVNWLSENHEQVASLRAAEEDPIADALAAAGASGDSTGAGRLVPPRSSPRPQPPPLSTRVQGDALLDYTAQVGAFTSQDRAEAMAERVRTAGFEPRVVQVPGSDFYRVRVGRFQTTEEARVMVDRLRETGFDAGVGADVSKEQGVG